MPTASPYSTPWTARPPKPALELLTLARRIGSPSAVVCGPDAERAVETLASHGAEHVYLAKDQRMLDYLVVPKVDALEQITRQIGADLATVSLVVMVAVSVAAAVVAASVPLAPRKAGPCSPP